jgi:nucleoside-diphosphate-sugar epimerase
MDALLNLASLGFGHAPGIVRAATEARLGRFVCISTTAVFTTLYARSKIVRKEAEQAVMSSGLRYTIIRPTMIFGSSKDRNISRLIRYVIRHRILPVAGAGQSKQQPVYVQDLAGAIVSALDSDKAVSRAYNVSGERAITFSEMVDTIGTLTGRRVKMIHIPYRPIVKTLGVLEAIGFQLPLKAEQIERLNEDKVFDHEDAVKDLAYRPRTFEEAIRLELAEMGVRSR